MLKPCTECGGVIHKIEVVESFAAKTTSYVKICVVCGKVEESKKNPNVIIKEQLSVQGPVVGRRVGANGRDQNRGRKNYDPDDEGTGEETEPAV
jgi:hypothetical protein